VVIESQLDKGKGSVATLLIQNGTLRQGDIIVAGEQFGRVRAITDEAGNRVKSAGPATPVSVLGLNGTPGAGDSFMVTKDEKRAREVADIRKDRATSERLATPAVSLDNLLESFSSSKTSLLNIVVKADVRGSLEAIVAALIELGNDEVKVNVVTSGVGGITESDVMLAGTSGAVIFGFNVRAESSAKKYVDSEGLDLRYYKVIYDLIDDVKAALTGMLSPEIREEIVGIADVREVFDSKKFGNVAGCMVIEGTISRSKKIRVLRDNIVIFEGELESLRHFKAEVEDVRIGTECGIGVHSYNDVKVGDQIEVFDTREVAREL
jgi:translation initiation factor IF-2